MTRKHNPPAKPWVHLTDVEKPFDQTNGAVDFDTDDTHDTSDVETDLLAKGVASNAITAGFLGGGI